MKPEDLVVGKLYEYKNKTYKYVTRQREFLTRGIVSVYVFKNLTGEHEFFDDEYLAFVKEIEEKPTPHPNIYTGEKTMPEQRKPEQITLELTQDEIIKALSSLGYDLTNYELSQRHSMPAFVLKLKKEADEKTKATD